MTKCAGTVYRTEGFRHKKRIIGEQCGDLVVDTRRINGRFYEFCCLHLEEWDLYGRNAPFHLWDGSYNQF